MRTRKKWLLTVAVVLALGLGYAAYSFLGGSGGSHLTVSQLRSQAASLHDQQVIVEGTVAPGSVDWDDKTQVIRFVLTDDKENLTIVYNGVAPDSFRPGAELIVVGTYRPDDVLEAMSLGRKDSLCNTCHQ